MKDIKSIIIILKSRIDPLLRQRSVPLKFVGAFLLMIALFFIFKSNQPNMNESEPVQDHEEKRDKNEHEDDEVKEIKLSAEQIERFDIQTLKLNKSHFQHRILLPGQIALNENKITHVVASVPGVVREIFKGLGETTKPKEPLLTLQSRDMADAKSAYISAYKNLGLKKDLFEREEKLWKLKYKAEVQFVQTRNTYENAKIELEQSKQKLLALNLTEEEIEKLPEQKTPLNNYTIDSPIEGKIIERHVTLGEVVSNDKQLFVIANLDTVWINLAIPAEDLPKVKKDQKVDIFAHQSEDIQSGTIMYVSPVINDESRTGRAVIELDNSSYALHPGDFIKAQVVISERSGFLSVPGAAIQKLKEQFFVFVKKEDGVFVAKDIQIKGSDKNEFIEVIKGINEGDEIVIKNAFLLKAELGKSEAEHSH